MAGDVRPRVAASMLSVLLDSGALSVRDLIARACAGANIDHLKARLQKHFANSVLFRIMACAMVADTAYGRVELSEVGQVVARRVLSVSRASTSAS